jgi:hypothetical protein
MSLDTKREAGLAELQEQLRRAPAIAVELMADVIARTGLRSSAQSPARRTRILHLVQAGAVAEAALALLAFEVPGWKLRRLVYEDGEWICSLSKHRELPDWLDDAAEAHHETLALAIVAAFVEAQSRAADSDRIKVPTVPQEPRATDCALYCDNFA